MSLSRRWGRETFNAYCLLLGDKSCEGIEDGFAPFGVAKKKWACTDFEERIERRGQTVMGEREIKVQNRISHVGARVCFDSIS